MFAAFQLAGHSKRGCVRGCVQLLDWVRLSETALFALPLELPRP